MAPDIAESDLFVRYQQTKDASLLDDIVKRYSYITDILSRRFAGKGLEYDDIYQSASIGLVNAVNRFEPDRGVQFSTYATPTILGEIKRLFRDKGSCIRVPRRMYEIFSQVNKIRNERLVISGTMPTRRELADALDITQKQLSDAMFWGDTQEIHSLEESLLDQDAVLADCIGVSDHEFLMIENKDFINRFLRTLSPKEQKFVRYRFYNEMTQQQIAERMQISQMTVSRLEKRILEQLKKLYEQTINAN